MTKIANGAAYFFVLTSFILTGVSIAGIWRFFEKDVVWKSFESIGLIALACVVILAVENFSTKGDLSGEEVDANKKSVKVFSFFRKIALAILIVCTTLFVFVGLLSIWDIVKGDVLHKFLATMATLGFFGLLTAFVCGKREKSMNAPNPWVISAPSVSGSSPNSEKPVTTV